MPDVIAAQELEPGTVVTLYGFPLRLVGRATFETASENWDLIDAERKAQHPDPGEVTKEVVIDGPVAVTLREDDSFVVKVGAQEERLTRGQLENLVESATTYLKATKDAGDVGAVVVK